MVSLNEERKRLLCWTVCAYRKPGMDEADYHSYMSKVHAPLVKDLMVKYGITRWSMVHFQRFVQPILPPSSSYYR